MASSPQPLSCFTSASTSARSMSTPFCQLCQLGWRVLPVGGGGVPLVGGNDVVGRGAAVHVHQIIAQRFQLGIRYARVKTAPRIPTKPSIFKYKPSVLQFVDQGDNILDGQ